jgi:TonB family protein
MRCAALAPALFCALLACPARAQTPLTPQAVQAHLHGPFLMLRGMYGGSRLHFNQHGRLNDLAGVVPFSLSALRLRSVRFDGRNLQILATRAGLEFHPAKVPGQPNTVTTVPLSPQDSAPGSEEAVEIFIRINRNHPRKAEKALDRIFSRGFDDQLAASAPAAWQPWLMHHLHPHRTNPTPAEDIESCRAPGLTPPRLLHGPQPAYTSAARSARYQGTVVLSLTIDPTGQPQNIVILRPLGMGLDESAVEAARRFLYSPAIRDGSPEACRADVAFTFQLGSS